MSFLKAYSAFELKSLADVSSLRGQLPHSPCVLPSSHSHHNQVQSDLEPYLLGKEAFVVGLDVHAYSSSLTHLQFFARKLDGYRIAYLACGLLRGVAIGNAMNIDVLIQIYSRPPSPKIAAFSVILVIIPNLTRHHLGSCWRKLFWLHSRNMTMWENSGQITLFKCE